MKLLRQKHTLIFQSHSFTVFMLLVIYKSCVNSSDSSGIYITNRIILINNVMSLMSIF